MALFISWVLFLLTEFWFILFVLELNATLPSLINLSYESFQPYKQISAKRAQNLGRDDFYAYGHLLVLNTLEDFATRDKRQLIIDAGKFIWAAISDETRQLEVDSDLEAVLSRFLMIVYADLKRYAYHYWCAFPALNYPPTCFQLVNSQTQDDTKLGSYFNHDQVYCF